MLRAYRGAATPDKMEAARVGIGLSSEMDRNLRLYVELGGEFNSDLMSRNLRHGTQLPLVAQGAQARQQAG